MRCGRLSSSDRTSAGKRFGGIAHMPVAFLFLIGLRSRLLVFGLVGFNSIGVEENDMPKFDVVKAECMLERNGLCVFF
jgi:hypothetical protein